jgi:hypothetical protein
MPISANTLPLPKTFATSSLDTTSQILSPTTSTAIDDPSVQAFTDQPTEASHTLITIFNFLAALLHSTHNQEDAAPSLSSLLGNVFTLISQTSGKKSADLDMFIKTLKEDCRQALAQALDELPATSSLDEYKRPSKEEKEAKAQAALCNVATIVSGVANIVQNPHDKINVGQSVGSILSGIINIAMLSSHKPRQHTLHYLTNTLN